jgi:hypothetical protein
LKLAATRGYFDILLLQLLSGALDFVAQLAPLNSCIANLTG